MNQDIDLDELESSWTKPAPDVTHSEDPSTELAIKAHSIFIDDQQAIDALACRVADLGISTVTTDNVKTAKDFVGTCRTARGRIEKLRKSLNADALSWTRVVNAKAGELTKMVESFEVPIKGQVKGIEDAKAKAKADAEAAEIKAIEDAAIAARAAEQAIEDAKRAAEAEANRIERERLAAERVAMEAERRKAEEYARIEREKLKAELDAKLAAERAEQAERDKIMAAANAAIKAQEDAERAAQKKIDDELREAQRIEKAKIEAELAEYRRQNAEREREKQAVAKAEQDRYAAEVVAKARAEADERERLRLEAIKPDLVKVHQFGTAILTTIADSPLVASDEAVAVLQRAVIDLNAIAHDLLKFGGQS